MEFDIVKSILSRKEDFLRRHLVLSTSVIEKLRQFDAIGNYTKDQMTLHAGNTDKQLTHLFVCLRTRGLSAFNGFLKVLRMTFHGWLADDLLDTTIVTGNFQGTSIGNVAAVRDVINNMHQSKIEKYPTRDDSFEKSKKNEATKGIQWKQVEKSNTDSDEEGRISPITKIPRNLRDLERVFDSESSATNSSLASLRQEEIHIRALLQQNIREQQDLLSKQDALIEIKDKMKDISKSATQLFRPEPESRIPSQLYRAEPQYRIPTQLVRVEPEPKLQTTRLKQAELKRFNWKHKK